MSDTHDSSQRGRWRRREVLAAGSTLGLAGVAGCLDDLTVQGDSGPQVVASFFTFYDFAREVATGTPVTVENLVPTGLHGHGWQPSADVTRDIIEADAFVHVGPDFQPWADRAIQTLKDDDIDTQLINSREGVELAPLAATLDRDEEGVGRNRGKDPHFWLDPRRAKTALDNITEGLIDLAPDHASDFRANAEDYGETLDRIDADYAALFEQADHDVVQLAAHNAFQYLGLRYGVRMRPLVVNLAASGDVKPSDITEAKEVIEDNGIEYIGAGVFETRKPARTLLAETPVEAYFPVTPYAGVREAWVAEDWGYEDIAYKINMPTFSVVLGVESPAEAGPHGWADTWRNFE